MYYKYMNYCKCK